MFRASRHPVLRGSSLQKIAGSFRWKNNAKEVGCQVSRLSSNFSQGPLEDARSTPLTLVSRNKRPLYSRNNEHSGLTTSKPWHDPSFLNDAQPPEKEEWLEALLQSPGQPDIQAFLLVLKSLSTWKHGGAPKRAEHWSSRLREAFPIDANMDESTLNTGSQLKDAERSAFTEAHLKCFLYTIQAWVNADKEDSIISVNRAETWLNKANHVAAKAPAKDIQPIMTECYNAFLDGCSKGRKSRTDRDSIRIHASKAEATLQTMIKEYKKLGGDSPVLPNTESVNFVMRAISQCRKDADIATRCKTLLQGMEKSDEQIDNSRSLVIRPNPKSYNLWLTALAAVVRLKAQKKNRTTGKSLDDGTEDMKVLHQAVDDMGDLFQRGRVGVIENNVPYNILLSAWAGVAGLHNWHDAPMKAENIFWAMVDLKDNHNFPEVAPDTTSYLQVIRAWAISGSDRSGERASWWIGQQWSDFKKSGNENLMPTTYTYTGAIEAWGMAGNPKQAEALLVQFLERYQELKVPQLEPNSEVYSATIRAWLTAAEAKENGQEEQIKAWTRAVEWLEGLVKGESDSGPAIKHDLFLTTMKAARLCAKHRMDVLELASRIFSNFRNSRHHVQPTVYSCLLQVGLLALSKPEDDFARTKFLTEFVTVCCDDGFLSRAFVSSLTNGPIHQEGWTCYESARISCVLFPDWPIPPSWTRNIQSKVVALPRAEDFQRTTFEFGNREF